MTIFSLSIDFLCQLAHLRYRSAVNGSRLILCQIAVLHLWGQQASQARRASQPSWISFLPKPTDVHVPHVQKSVAIESWDHGKCSIHLQRLIIDTNAPEICCQCRPGIKHCGHHDLIYCSISGVGKKPSKCSIGLGHAYFKIHVRSFSNWLLNNLSHDYIK